MFICKNISSRLILVLEHLVYYNSKYLKLIEAMCNDLKNDSLCFITVFISSKRFLLCFCVYITLTLSSRLHERVNVRQSSMDDAFFLCNMLKSCRASLVADVRATLTACSLMALIRYALIRYAPACADSYDCT